MKNRYLALFLLFLLSSFLRFWQLGQDPPSLTWDEAAWGYNAYSLGIDGRDEFGKFLPLQYLESFGDFKPPVYAYLDTLPVKIFGLNEFAVRFPSALFGVLTVIMTYFLTKRLFSQNPKSEIRNPKQIQNSKFKIQKAEMTALLAALFLAISPWHINLSRAAFEANVATFFLVGGVWLFLLAIQEKKWSLPLSFISFALAMYTFNTSRIVAPLLIGVLIVGFHKSLLKMKGHLLVAVTLAGIIIFPLLQFLATPQSRLRFHEVNIFSDLGVIERTNQEIINDQNTVWSRILHNRRLAYGVEYLKHYLGHFNPSFLFIKGDGNPKFSTQDVGELYLWDLPFLIFGILLLIRKRQGFWWIIPLWLVVGIAPAATARETPHALRIETTLPTWQILTAFGFIGFWEWLKRVKNQKSLIFGVVFTFSLLIFNFIYYYHGYLAHYPKEYSHEWQYGYKEAVSYVQSVENGYDEIFFTDVLGRPYVYFLFYTKEDPAKFRAGAKIWREPLGFVHVDGYGKYQFTKDLGITEASGKKVLFVDTPNNVPNNATIREAFFLLSGERTLVAYTL